MVALPQSTLTLAEFLSCPETKPASEYAGGYVWQKPMPKGRHSVLQSELVMYLNAALKPQRRGYAFPELRCTFGDRSLVPDVAVFAWENIPRTPAGTIADTFDCPPDWTIEILSPEQRAARVTGKILACLEAGGQLGWLLDPEEQTLLAYPAGQQPMYCQELEAFLPVPEFAGALKLTLGEVFGWLQL